MIESPPPVGCISKWRWQELRLHELAGAIHRYTEYDKFDDHTLELLIEWSTEFLDVAWQLKSEKSSQ